MKATCKVRILALFITFGAVGAIAAQSGYSVVERGLNHRVFQKTTMEHGTNRIHRYTELATGLNYTNSAGQLTESSEQITLLPTGGASATQGQHKVYFPADIYNGVLQVTTPDRRNLYSRPLAVSYDDGSNTVFIATLTNSVGCLLSSNQVIYRNAFSGLKADIIATYRRGGFECDLVLRGQPPAPDAFGLDTSYTTLQMVTEFFDTKDPTQIPAASDEWFGLQDSTLKFGKLTMTRGRAFAFNGTNAAPAAPRAAAQVYKSWLHSGDRTFLVEQVPLVDVADDLNALPLTASIANPSLRVKYLASGPRAFPPGHERLADTNQILLAKVDFPPEAGVVLDYTTISGSETSYTFQDSQTYYLSGYFNADNVTIEPGAVIKLKKTGAGIGLDCDQSVDCETTPDKPAVFTAVDDDTVGDEITEVSTHTPNGYYGEAALSMSYLDTGAVHDLRFYHQNSALGIFGCSSILLQNLEFHDCSWAINFGEVANSPRLNNLLVENCGSLVECGTRLVGGQITHITATNLWGGYLVNAQYYFWSDATFKNCLLQGGIKLTEEYYNPDIDDIESIDTSGSSNNSYYAYYIGVNTLTNAAPFEFANRAKFYLKPNSPYRNAGTASIDPAALADIRTMTSYAPQYGGFPDNDGTPDLGYHYPVNEDSDYDRLPDWWEWQYFGTYDNKGNSFDGFGRTLLYDYQHGIAPVGSLGITQQPLSQNVDDGDTVTFSVSLNNPGASFQWTFNGVDIPDATDAKYTINNVTLDDEGTYACTITTAGGTGFTQNATLSVFYGYSLYNEIIVEGQRQDYSFRSGILYIVYSPVQLIGKTTFEGGALIGFNSYGQYPGLEILGPVDCQGGPYNPTDLVFMDSGYGSGLTAPLLDLNYAGDISFHNLRFRYADVAVVAPSQSRLDLWNCQFLQCNTCVASSAGGTASFHNVLFAGCGDAIDGGITPFSMEMEHVTADVDHVWRPNCQVNRVALTNSIFWGDKGSAISYSEKNVAWTPDEEDFTNSTAGTYYLAANSPLRAAGTVAVSARLLQEFRGKTTTAPMLLPVEMTVRGHMVFGPQAPRYSSGSPDLGYYYDALDYTASALNNAGNITVEPGTVFGFRSELALRPAGVYLWEDSTFTSHGFPEKPILFTDVDRVQEQYIGACGTLFAPDFQGVPTDAGPTLDMRFSQLYAGTGGYLVWAGWNEKGNVPVSYDSVVNWRMQDCELHGGKVVLGAPVDDGYHPDYYFGAGSVIWRNNLFDRVLVGLAPSPMWNETVVRVDLSFEARNNLFRGRGYFEVQAVTANAPQWVFSDNLFDQSEIYQLADWPVIADYNAYWPLTKPYFSGDSWHLLDGDTGAGGTHDVKLGHAPPYGTGPFGSYYITAATPLHQAGSQSAPDARLYHYTTFTSQAKEADSPKADIGLHYIAADSTGKPKDSDNDGIPDYVENWHGDGHFGFYTDSETDWQNPITDNITPDLLSSLYLDIDLSGDGLVGRIKIALGMNPLDAKNPLALAQITTGNEPEVLTFSLPIAYNLIGENSPNNIGKLNLLFDGKPLSISCSPDPNGLCNISWNSTFTPPGEHLVQAEVNLAQKVTAGPNFDPTTITGAGILIQITNRNAIQFDPYYCVYDNLGGAVLYARTPTCPDVDYTIELKTMDGQHIRTISGSSSIGEIREPWDLTDDNGNPVEDTSIKAVFNITLLDPGNYSYELTLQQILAMNDGNFTVAYACNSALDNFGLHRTIQLSIVDALLMICNWSFCHPHPYSSTFNKDSALGTEHGDPGHLSNVADSGRLINNLRNNISQFPPQIPTKNFYFFGHGSSGNFGTVNDDVTISVHDIAYALNNQLFAFGGGHVPPGKYPLGERYRFVFLDCCYSAYDPDFAHAFGIWDRISTQQLSERPEDAQAFVGWTGMKRIPISAALADIANCQNVFWAAWMSGMPLDRCIWYASQNLPPAPYNFIDLYNYNLGPNYQHWGAFDYWRLGLTGPHDPRPRIYGYAGLTREGFVPGYDNSEYYK